MTYVSVSERNHVWAINANDVIYKRNGACNSNLSGINWKKIPGSLKQISVGYSGVWGVDRNNNLYYRTGTYGDTGSDGSAWEKISGNVKYVSSGLGIVIAVSTYNDTYIRGGTSQNNPAGTYWNRVNGHQIIVQGYDNLVYWGVTRKGSVYHS